MSGDEDQLPDVLDEICPADDPPPGKTKKKGPKSPIPKPPSRASSGSSPSHTSTSTSSSTNRTLYISNTTNNNSTSRHGSRVKARPVQRNVKRNPPRRPRLNNPPLQRYKLRSTSPLPSSLPASPTDSTTFPTSNLHVHNLFQSSTKTKASSTLSPQRKFMLAVYDDNIQDEFADEDDEDEPNGETMNSLTPMTPPNKNSGSPRSPANGMTSPKNVGITSRKVNDAAEEMKVEVKEDKEQGFGGEVEAD
ncbi:hypothetical protein TL16_g07848 [Triparma laevis f. inornata]|uniref:Uncharacterized protein n=1 Tax=Triparma laevis f. inornata TaxID=1714386 RepID=A0A9W7EIX4_9STRA|nr:hypothetical protein TL16_g07848 [Triparma laevis f. inornata]